MFRNTYESRRTIGGSISHRLGRAAALAAAAWLSSAPATYGQDCNSNGIPDPCDISCGAPGGPCDVPGCGQSQDCNGNGVPDQCDPDSDADGVIDTCDNCPLTSNLDQADSDSDGVGNACDGCPSDPDFNGIEIPAGEFDMGDHLNEGDAAELPVHAVYVDLFFMDRYEVTNQQYAEALNWANGQGGLISVTSGVVYKFSSGTSYPYCDTTTSAPAASWITYSGGTFGVVSGKQKHPMVNVSWYGAAAYANWRSAMQGRQPRYNTSTSTWPWIPSTNGYRLATEAEWEKAARGGLQGKRYPWGDTLVSSKVNYGGSGDPYDDGTTPVGFYTGALWYKVDFGWPGSQTSYQTSEGVNGYGVYDVAGNVWEWCNDWFSSTYYSVSPPANPPGPLNGSEERVLRGGSGLLHNNEPYVRCAGRISGTPAAMNDDIGFRLAVSVLDTDGDGIDDVCDTCPNTPPDAVVDANGCSCAQKSCDDSNACTNDSCDPQTVACIHAPTNCDDSNPCTDDSCDSITGCVHTNNSNPCDDGSACTENDTCTDGACSGALVNCSDGNPCTDDSCVPQTGCVHDNNNNACDDGNACTTADTCTDGCCVGLAPGGTTEDCDNNCIPDECDIAVGASSDCNGDGVPDACNLLTGFRQYKIPPRDPDENDWFGIGVGVSGDTIVVGARMYDQPNASNAGAAYVFTKEGFGWTYREKLVPDPAPAEALFGQILAIDGETLLVGATQSASAYIFVRNGGNWTQQQRLLPSDSSDDFGYAVALSGETAVVGSPNSNSAYVFVRNGTTWTQQAKLTGSGRLGWSVAISGDTLVAGAPQSAGGGSAFVYVRNGTVWTQQAELIASDGVAGDNCISSGVGFGGAAGTGVAIDGDTILVGSGCHDHLGDNSGAAYVFVRNGSNWAEQQELLATGGLVGEHFGWSVAIEGDTAVVGASGAEIDTLNGSAYIFTRSGSTWTQKNRLTAADGGPNDAFGVVAIDGKTIVIGAPWYGGGSADGSGSGAAYVFVSQTDCNQNTIPDECDTSCPNATALWQSSVSMPEPRNGTDAAKDSQGRIYIPGGNAQVSNVNTAQSSVMRFDEDTHTWELIASLNTARQTPAIASDALGRIYVIGGGDASGLIGSVERYDPTNPNAGWTFVEPLPEPRTSAKAVTDSSGRIYVAGGDIDTSGSNPVASVLVYQPGVGWSAHSSMQTPRHYFGFAIDGQDRLYAIGGATTGNTHTDTFERYDPGLGTWSYLAPISTSRHIGASVVDKCGFIYAIGGWEPGYSCTVQRYDPLIEAWQSFASIIQCRNNMAGITGASGRVYVMGGDAGFTPQTTVEVLIPASADCNHNQVPDECEPEQPGVCVASVVGRHVFYNNSFFDSNTSTCRSLLVVPECNDNTAIATDKTALRPGVPATTANYISFDKSINGIMVDLASPGSLANIGADDFIFRIGNDANPGAWPLAAAPVSVSALAGAGDNGSDRITIIWANNAIPNTSWLQVTVLSNADTGLPANDVHYWGIEIGEGGTPTATRAIVSSTDEIAARNHPHNSLNRVGVGSGDAIYDYDKSSTISSTDEIIARNNPANSLTALLLITPP